MLEHLDCVVANTTRRGQLVAAECLGRLMKGWRLAADSPPLCQQVFKKAANILSTLLIVPRYAQLRTETLQVSLLCTVLSFSVAELEPLNFGKKPQCDPVRPLIPILIINKKD
jgi:hypothetical protein